MLYRRQVRKNAEIGLSGLAKEPLTITAQNLLVEHNQFAFVFLKGGTAAVETDVSFAAVSNW